KKIISGNLERIGLNDSFLGFRKGNNKQLIKYKKIRNHQEALGKIIDLEDVPLDRIGLVGHRVVTGGHKFIKTVLVNKKVFAQLKKNDSLAPLHNPPNIMGITASFKILPQAKNVAVFDTSFHNSLPDYAYTYGLPQAINKKLNIRRYGFHGISHQYVAGQAAIRLKKPLKKLNLISCHLGNGCSIAAIRAGRSVDTSMGFTPLEGLLMGTRCGDIDPALVTFLLTNLKISPQQLDQLLNKQSGLKGISGISNDLREILVAAGYRVPGFKPNKKFSKVQKKNAKLALSIYLYRLKKYISAYYGILGKVDAVIFTAGTGERNADIRKMAMKGLPFAKKVKVLAIPTNEELLIARQAKRFVK
ncbi:acetate/propionate family kinase, partial [Patescibacteria group bacterium]|nr:acetate/propionate family kinase [Patescibacteria group bacterium]